MRLAMILAALGLVLLLPAAEAAAGERRQDAATAQQPRSGSPQAPRSASPANREASQPRTASAARTPAASRQRTAAAQRPTAEPRQAAQAAPTRPAQAAAARQANAAQQQGAGRATAQRSGLFRSAAAAPAGIPRATGTCARRDAQGRCVRTTASNTRWQGGLPPMTMAQQECPSGTVATLARGHANVVRCLPI